MFLSQRLLHKTLLLVRDLILTSQCIIIQLHSFLCDMCMYVSVEVGTPDIEGTFTSSDDVVKSIKHSQAASSSGENIYASVHLLLYCVGVVDEVRMSVKDLKKKFRLIRRSMIQCLNKCQIAVMTVVTLLTYVLDFKVREAVSESYHRDLSGCRELFGYLNLYWNYLSFKPLSLLLDEPALMNDNFASVRKEMCAYLEDITKFVEDTTLVAFCSAVPYTEHHPPPGFQKMVTEHDWPETVTLREVKKFQKDFLDTFSLPEHAMMLDVIKIKRGSFKITWFMMLPATTIRNLKESMGKIKAFRDFNVALVEIDNELLFQTSNSEKVYIHQ